MSNLDNNFNINNANRAYTPNLKKGEETVDAKPQKRPGDMPVEILNDGAQAAESYGRILVKQAGKVDNPEMVQCIKDAVDFYLNNPQLAQAGVKAGDSAYELLSAQGANDAYEKACCGACDAVESRINK